MTLSLPDLDSWVAFYRGIAEVHEVFTRWADALELDVALEHLAEADGQVVVAGRARGRFPESGRRFDLPVVQVWTVRGGAVDGLEVYVGAAARHLGGPHPAR